MASNDTASSGSVMLPPGVTVSGGRETTSVNAQGIVVQGMNFTINLPGGAMTTVFIPYSDLGNTAQVQAMIMQRVQSILAVTG